MAGRGPAPGGGARLTGDAPRRVAPAAAVALLLPAGCLSLGQLSVGAQQAVRGAEDFSELYKDFDADVQALLRGGTGGPGDPFLEDAPADALEEPSRMQQDSQPQAPSRTASLAQTELDSQPELAAEAEAEAQLAADQQLTWPPAGAGAVAPPAEASPWAPEGDAALPPEDAATVALEQRTVSSVQLYSNGLAGEITEQARPDIDDVLARTEKTATVLARDSGRLAQELSLLTWKGSSDPQGRQNVDPGGSGDALFSADAPRISLLSILI